MANARKSPQRSKRSGKKKGIGGPAPRMIEAQGKCMSITEWARYTGIGASTIYYRLRNGWDPKDAVSVTPHIYNRAVQTEDGVRYDLHLHGDFGSKEYRTWAHMIGRCYDSNDKSYHRYGARGILVCPEWRGPGGYQNFLEVVGRAPSSQHTLERPNNSMGYFPDNVTWATPTEQARNRRTSRMVTAFGKTQSLAAWAAESELKYATIQRRLDKGWDPERALTEPLFFKRPKPPNKEPTRTRKEAARSRNSNKIITALGKSQCIAAWSEETGLKAGTINQRLKRGWPPDEAVSVAPHNHNRATLTKDGIRYVPREWKK